MNGTSYPVSFAVEYPDRDLNRVTSFFRIFMVIPIAFVLGTVGGEGWHNRVIGYALTLVTDEYPTFRLHPQVTS